MGKRLTKRAAKRAKAKSDGTFIPKSGGRAAQRQMQQMGMNMEEVNDVTEVVIKRPSGDIVIKEPQVALVKQKGMQIYQVIGNPEGETAEVIQEKEDVSIEIPESDIALVVSQASVSPEEAKKALEENDGDLARAIISLKS
ncbi:MAG: nascent polypeptide-associated complex protein [Candidatus Ranarchaeia archaeon]